ncbi:hypothetical protein ACLB2K_014126 [Fragaria x ananassa]
MNSVGTVQACPASPRFLTYLPSPHPVSLATSPSRLASPRLASPHPASSSSPRGPTPPPRAALFCLFADEQCKQETLEIVRIRRAIGSQSPSTVSIRGIQTLKMLIEEVKEATATEEEQNVKSQKPSSSSAHKDASDGFETASDGELGPTDSDDESQHHFHLQEEPQNLSEADQQKSLEQANEVKLQGNGLFGNGQYEEALSQYELALQLAPDMPSSVELRSICHSNRAICFSKLGKYEDAVKECTKAVELNPSYLKALIRRAEAHEKLEHFEEAITDMKKILELDPSNDQARKAIRRLEPLAEAKREKMKEEMIGKLKDMGNSLLGRFGMSVDNFKAVKDPNTGSYSISFQR